MSGRESPLAPRRLRRRPLRRYAARTRLLLVVLLLAATALADAREYVVTESDFACLLDWPKLPGHDTRIFNRNRRRLRRALHLLEKNKPHRRYPVGTILELVPPLPAAHFLGEAMVKRERGFNPPGNDWEFFVLDVNPDRTTRIVKRGRAEVVNVGLPCQTCHAAAKTFDLVCEGGHGCIALNLTSQLIDTLQTADPRCGP